MHAWWLGLYGLSWFFGIFVIIMKIVVAPDSFKECLSAAEVAKTIAMAVCELCPENNVVELPLADGGEGTLDVLAEVLGARIEHIEAHDPLERLVKVRYGISGETAIIEVAQACGLQLLASDERNPLIASTKGVGELLMAAYNNGCRHFIIGLGGTATCDGGAGMLSVDGIKDALKECSIELLCDVDAPFVGDRGAARVFAPQKGASAEDVEVLEARMAVLAANILKETGVDIADMPGAGAAGGLGGALIAYGSARLTNGAMRVMQLCGFIDAIKDADLIITGEGKSDAQTLMGKVPYSVLMNSSGVPVALLSGRIEDRTALGQAGLCRIIEISPRDIPLSSALFPDTAKCYIRSAVTILFEKDKSHVQKM
jgi:glycerate kinase